MAHFESRLDDSFLICEMRHSFNFLAQSVTFQQYSGKPFSSIASTGPSKQHFRANSETVRLMMRFRGDEQGASHS